MLSVVDDVPVNSETHVVTSLISRCTGTVFWGKVYVRVFIRVSVRACVEYLCLYLCNSQNEKILDIRLELDR